MNRVNGTTQYIKNAIIENIQWHMGDPFWHRIWRLIGKKASELNGRGSRPWSRMVEGSEEVADFWIGSMD